MRARALFAVVVGVFLLAVASPAAAKAMIAVAHISGPGLDGEGLRISGPDTEGMWGSGIDVVGGLDDARADSIAQLGLATPELGPRYLVTYRFVGGYLIRQDLYPYAEGGPLTNTPPRQDLIVGVTMTITAGWYQSSREFFHYLTDQGLPETNPVAVASDRASASGPMAAAASTPWGWILLALAGPVTLSLAAPRLRRRAVVVANRARTGAPRDMH